MKRFLLLAGLFCSFAPKDARPTAACNNDQLKKIIDSSIVANNLALSSAKIRTQLASISDEKFFVICDEKPVTFASPEAIFCQRASADVFCTVVQITGTPLTKITRVHPPLVSEAIISSRRDKPIELESSELEDSAEESTPTTRSKTTSAAVHVTLPIPKETPVTEAIPETTTEQDGPIASSPNTTDEQTLAKDDSDNEPKTTTSTTKTLTGTKSETATIPAPVEPSTETTELSTLVENNGDSFFEMMIANQEDARRSMMNTSPPPPLQEVDEGPTTVLPATEGLAKEQEEASQSVDE
ncbi:hypothetical protein QR680_002548 [Steinernema hermaphroditum]|uniref:Ground-like domain-containing protein n=1 Tax=Steinernema hermaphroditum TaxID=289476 RepID=A0AA39H345_9BILA|nr:hypothetical protein QR680_002548 [Steinernema hermaphroditum]